MIKSRIPELLFLPGVGLWPREDGPSVQDLRYRRNLFPNRIPQELPSEEEGICSLFQSPEYTGASI